MRPGRATPLYPFWTNTLPNFMCQDVLGSLAGVLVFAFVLYAPGYLLAHATNLFGFRRLPFAERSLWAIAASFCVAPIAAHLVGPGTGLTGVTLLFATMALLTAILLARSRPAWPRRDRKITVVLALGWTAAVLLLSIDIQLGHKLYFSVILADQSYRVAFTDAVLRTGIPPANPLYFAGSPAPMRYFYFWYMLCAAVARLAHISARQAFIASSVWAGFGLLATVHLYTTHFFRWGRRQRWLALSLLLISGAGLIPALGQALLQPALNGDTEWWSVDPIDAWPDSLLWVPHHVASVLCCLLAFLLLWRTFSTQPAPIPNVSSRPKAGSRTEEPCAFPVGPPRQPATLNTHRAPILLAACAAASAFGLSVYVAFGFALLTAAWLLRLTLLHDRNRLPWLGRATLTAVLASLLLLPFLGELLNQPDAGTAPTIPHLFTFSVRRMIDPDLLTGLPLFAALHRNHPALLDQTVRLLLLPPGLAMELGVYGAVLVFLLLARYRKAPLPPDPARSSVMFFTVTGLILTMFLRSAVITNNDFGYRAVMLPQFFLLLLTADVLGSWQLPTTSRTLPPTPAKRTLVYALLILGAAGTLYWAILLRAWLPFEVAHPQTGFSRLPEDNFQIRRAFYTLNQAAPADAVVAFRPIDTPAHKQQVMDPNEFYQRLVVMNAGRQILNAEGKCATHFGGNPIRCPEIQAATAQLYGSPAPSADWARSFCSRFGVQFLTLSAWDPDWGAGAGWPITLPSVAEEPRFRILACR